MTIQNENQTLASITFQNYFRLYPKLVGHDRHRHDRSRRIRGNLQARRRRNSRPTSRSSASMRTMKSIAPTERKVRGGRPRDRRRQRQDCSRCWSAPTSIEKSEQLAECLVNGRATTSCSMSRSQAARKRRSMPRPARHNLQRIFTVLNARYPRAGGLHRGTSRAFPARSRSLPTWQGAARTFSSAAISTCGSAGD